MKVSKEEAEKFVEKLDFEKEGGLVPAIAQDWVTGEVRMLAFQNKEAVMKTLTTGNIHYYSRSRKKLWRKGEESGNVQEMERYYTDCDVDSVLYKVKQKGPSCHLGNRTCFEQGDFPIERIWEIVMDRKENPKDGSYTNKLLSDRELAVEKVKEESKEVIDSIEKEEGKKQVVWEASDLIYHLLVLLAEEGVDISDIQKELKSRHSK